MLRRTVHRFSPFMEICMPALSPSMESGTLVKWNVALGSKITQGTSICSIQTDKAVVSFDHQMDDGYLARLFAKDGDVVEVGKLIAILAEEESDISKASEFSPKPGSLPGSSAVAAEVSSPVAASASSVPAVASLAVNGASSFASVSEAIAASGPAVARIAREVGEDQLKSLTPSGKGGRFTKGDVIALQNSSSQPSINPATNVVAPAKVVSSFVVPVNPGKVYNFNVSDSRLLASLFKNRTI